MTKKFRELEILVAKIQRQLAPDAEVLHDVKLLGRASKIERQIDVLVRQKIGQYEMLIVLDCKDHDVPVDVKGVEEFYGLLTDVGAHKGALVCPKGFTSTAKTRATGLQIDLFSPVDTDPHKWQVRVAVPTICDFRSAKMSFRVICSVPLPFYLPPDFVSKIVAFSAEQKELGIPLEIAMKKWNEGLFPTEPGIHADLSIFDKPEVLVDNGYNDLVPVELTVSLWVDQQLYFGELPVSHISGFKDELSGNVISNAFTIGILDPEEVERDWAPINSDEELPVRPLLELIGLIGLENYSQE